MLASEVAATRGPGCFVLAVKLTPQSESGRALLRLLEEAVVQNPLFPALDEDGALTLSGVLAVPERAVLPEGN